MEKIKNENRCKLCKEPINLDDFESSFEIPQLMAKKHVCFSCGFWIKRKEYDEKLWKEYFNSGTTNSSRIPVVTPNWEHWIVKTLSKSTN